MMIIVMMAVVEAKTYKPFAGHPAVQYYQSDMGYPLKKYIERVEYDTDYNAQKPGVRLYLTSYGKDQINSPGGSYYLEKVTSYVTRVVQNGGQIDPIPQLLQRLQFIVRPPKSILVRSVQHT